MTIHLEIRHLNMLVSFAETASLTETAAKLNITPSALSHRMREAERRLGVPLFHRQHGRVELTSAGHLLLSTARSITNEITQAEKEVVLLHYGFNNVLRIGSRANCINAWLADFWKEVQNRESALAIEVTPNAAIAPVEALRLNEIDLAIITGSPPGGFDSVHLFQDELVGVLPAGHVKRNKEFLVSEDFLNESFVTYGLDLEPNHEYELMFSHDGGMPRRMINVGTIDLILDFVRAGIGLSILPRCTIHRKYHADLITLPLTDRGLSIDWHALIARGIAKDSPQKKVLEYLRNRRPG